MRTLLLTACTALVLAQAPAHADEDRWRRPAAERAEQGERNEVRFQQRGQGRLRALQRGASNLAQVVQSGSGNASAISQLGIGNVAIVRQRGDGNSATVNQTGDANVACLIQFGGVEGQIVQTGGQSTGIVQGPFGTREIPVAACAAAALGQRGRLSGGRR